MALLSRPISSSIANHFPLSPSLRWPSSFFCYLFSSMKVGSPSPPMALCLSLLDSIVMKVLIRIWFHDVHCAHCNGAWAWDMTSRIWWLSWSFKNHNVSSLGVERISESRIAIYRVPLCMKGYSLWCVIALCNLQVEVVIGWQLSSIIAKVQLDSREIQSWFPNPNPLWCSLLP